MYTLALADDHILTRITIKAFLQKQFGYNILMEAENGYDLLKQLNKSRNIPDIVLMDMNMKIMDGVAATFYLQQYYPSVCTIGLSVYHDEMKALQMLLAGAKAYISKHDIDEELLPALQHIQTNGWYVSKRVSLTATHQQLLHEPAIEINEDRLQLTGKEMQFLMLCGSSTLEYVQIAELMNVSIRTVENYQRSLKEKYHLRYRHELNQFALQHGIAKIANYGFTPLTKKTK